MVEVRPRVTALLVLVLVAAVEDLGAPASRALAWARMSSLGSTPALAGEGGCCCCCCCCCCSALLESVARMYSGRSRLGAREAAVAKGCAASMGRGAAAAAEGVLRADRADSRPLRGWEGVEGGGGRGAGVLCWGGSAAAVGCWLASAAGWGCAGSAWVGCAAVLEALAAAAGAEASESSGAASSSSSQVKLLEARLVAAPLGATVAGAGAAAAEACWEEAAAAAAAAAGTLIGEEAAAAAPAALGSLRAAIGAGCVGAAAAAAARGAEAWGVLAALPARARCKGERWSGRAWVVSGGAQTGGGAGCACPARGCDMCRAACHKALAWEPTFAFFSSALLLSFSMRASMEVTSDSKASGFMSDMAARGQMASGTNRYCRQELW